MGQKRKTDATKFLEPKKQKRQLDIAAGFAAQILRSPRKGSHVPSRPISSQGLEIEDTIEVSSDEDTLLTSQHKSPRRTKIFTNGPTSKDAISHATLPKIFSQRQSSTSINQSGPNSSNNVGTQTDSKSWLDRSTPKKTADLAVHKKKIADVQSWIEASFRNISSHTVLTLTGPAGTGKTATIEALGQQLDFDVIEWKNPMSNDWSEGGYDRDTDGLAQKFERFLAISDKYSVLDFGQSSEPSDGRRKVILVEDLPNTFMSSTNAASSAKLAFQNSIKRYLSSPRNKYPLILIITETEPRGDEGDWRRSDAMSVRTLMSREILESRNLTQIAFNEVAPTFISKALARIVNGLPRDEAVDISQAVLDEVATHANGDIRSAINTLEFISHKFSTHGRAPKPRRRKKRGEVLTLSPDEASVLNIITNREAALGYFHAVGKVIFNKRIPESQNPIPYDPLPNFLHQEIRLRPETRASAIIDETSTDIPTFLMGIHQNYIDSTADDLSRIHSVLEHLSLSDSLAHGFQQDHRTYSSIYPIAAELGVSGALHALPQNAKREGLAKVYFPTLIDRLTRTRLDEIHHASRLLDGQWQQQQQQLHASLTTEASASSLSTQSLISTESSSTRLLRMVEQASYQILMLAGQETSRAAILLNRQSRLGQKGIDPRAGNSQDDDDDDDDHDDRVLGGGKGGQKLQGLPKHHRDLDGGKGDERRGRQPDEVSDDDIEEF